MKMKKYLLHKNSQQSKKKIMKTIPFIVASNI